MHETLRCEWIKCGKPSCGSCPHGPYWYGYFRIDGKLRKKYYGKNPPGKVKADPDKPDEREKIFARATASAALAWQILGLPEGTSQKQAKLKFRELSFENHPDRGGEERTYKYITCAWSYLCSVYGW